MSERIHALAQVLLGKTSLEECNIEEIQHLTKRYPYFAPAQFLLLQKLEATGSPDADAQRQKAILYFHNPLQFDHFIAPEKFTIDEPFLDQEPEEESFNTTQTTDWKEDNESLLTEEASLHQQDDFTAIAQQDEAQDFESGDVVEEEPAETEEENEPAAFFREENPATAEEPQSTHVHEIREEEVFVPVEPVPLDSYQQENEPDEKVEPDKEEIVDAIEEQQPLQTDTTAALVEPETAPSLNAEPSFGKSIAAHLSTSSAQPNNTELTFEPFHTVDYFASQGIKIAADDLPKDRLSKQLRSFTEWLKVMKRLPASEVAVSPESPSEKTVENLAIHSVEESDVVTEAMAEVWLKQGNRQKAMETYNKLSLLNPSKRAYFAAKIENLKGS